MTLHYTLDANDYLQHQLFAASTADPIKKQRRKTWLIFSGALLVSGLAFYQSGNRDAAYTALFFGLLCIFFFPVYQGWYYKRHFQKFIADTYKNRIDQPVNFNLTDDYIEISDVTSESKIMLNGIESITETGNYFY